MVDDYKRYYDEYMTIQHKSFQYTDMTKANGSNRRIQPSDIIEKLKYSKGPSIEHRTNDMWAIIKPYLRGTVSETTGKPYVKIDLCNWQVPKFQIKNFTNAQRMGVRNLFSPTDNQELLNNELNKTKNSILVVFDDNISGGATLSDVCYQFSKLGVEYILPITFGEMNKKDTIGVLSLNRPKNDNGNFGFNM